MGRYLYANVLSEVPEGGEVPEWVHAVPYGTWQHPKYGEIHITPERVQRYAANVNNNVRGIDPSIDYDHNEGKAAGWVKQAEQRDTGLWLKVEWTPDAAESIKKKEYRYFSPELWDEWTNPTSGEKYEDIIPGGALTNRPFLKELVPLNFSEVAEDETPVPYDVVLIEQGFYQQGIQLRDIPKSERDKHPASDFAGKARSFPIFVCEDVGAAASSMGRAGPSNFDTGTLRSNITRIAKRKGFTACLPDAWKGGEESVEEFLKKLRELIGLSEGDEDKVLETITAKLAENKPDPEVEKRRKFAEDYPEEAARLAEGERKLRLTETNHSVTSWIGNGLPPVVGDMARKFLMSEQDAPTFGEVIEKFLELGPVPKGEIGKTAEGEGGEPDLSGAGKKFKEKMDAKMKENDKLSATEAMRLVAHEEPELYQEWRATRQEYREAS